MTAKKAVCVGINRFKYLPGAALRGCVNDANDMAALLRDTRDYAASAITLLTDSQATKENIMAALNALVDEAVAGKLSEIVFSLSSHGSQTPDKDGDETDGLDEIFCAHDIHPSGNIWDPTSVISDDEFNALFKKLPPNVKLEVFLDTCHSGTGLRALDPEKLLSMYLYDKNQPVKFRYLPQPSAMMIDLSRSLQAQRTRTFDMPKPAQDSNRMFWAACKDSQTSADAFFNGRPNGAFTYFYLQTARSLKGGSSPQQILSKVVASLKAAGYDQDPQFDSNPL